jgi:hypothetical protein
LRTSLDRTNKKSRAEACAGKVEVYDPGPPKGTVRRNRGARAAERRRSLKVEYTFEARRVIARSPSGDRPGHSRFLSKAFECLLDFHDHTKQKGLILAQSERWRRVLGMQVERESRKASSVAKG